MAFLMLLHEKMRLKRQVNKLTAKQLKNGNFLDRMTKRIEKEQKYYSKLESKLEKDASLFQKQFDANVLGGLNGGWNPGYYDSRSPRTYQIMSELAKQAGLTNFQDMYNEYYSGTLNGHNKSDDDKTTVYGNGNFSYEEYSKFNACMQQAQINCQNQQQFMTAQQQSFSQNVSVWLEAQKAQLELEQEMALAPLEEMQTEYELEKNSIEAQLTLAKERLQTVEQELGEQAKNNTPKFGLG